MLKTNLLIYLKFSSKLYDFELNKDQEKNILTHLLKIDSIVLIFLNLYILIFNNTSKLFFQKKIYELNDKQIILLKKFFYFSNFFSDKFNQIFFSVICFHLYGNEEVKPKKIDSKKVENKLAMHKKFIVIGSGPSGSVTSLELSKKFPGEVLMIEKGGHFSMPKTKHPGQEFSNKWYRGGFNATYFPEVLAFSSGVCLGGGSEINSGLYYGPGSDFLENWSKDYKTEKLDLSLLDKHIRKVETLVENQQKEKGNFSNLFEIGSKNKRHNSLKLKKFFDFKENQKNSMSETLIRDFKKNNGVVEVNTEVIKIKFNKGKWNLKAKQNDKQIKFSCDYLFLCCGSIFTSSLLLKNGIAKNYSRTLRNFKFHPMLKIIGTYEKNIQTLNEDVITNQNTNFYPKFLIGNSSSSLQFLISSFYDNKKIRSFIYENWKKMKIFHATFSLGRGKIFHLPFFKEPILLYFLNKNEKKIMLDSYNELINFISATSAKSFIPITSKKTDIYNKVTIKKLLKDHLLLKKLQMSSVHILGGVTMGESKKCVANSFGKINGHEGIYVNDSSLINNDLLNNPQGTVMAIAYRNIENFLDNLENRK
tara:strand:- start:438 stop:2207 length:1770 start_codon:yes stop_codon:yes gene_type:complete